MECKYSVEEKLALPYIIMVQLLVCDTSAQSEKWFSLRKDLALRGLESSAIKLQSLLSTPVRYRNVNIKLDK